MEAEAGQEQTTPSECRDRCRRLRCVMVLPTYNNIRTLPAVIEDALEWCGSVIVVNDGSTDGTEDFLCGDAKDGVTVVSYPDNRGKGHALLAGLRKAIGMGYAYAATMDTDGQHFASDLPALLSEEENAPGSLVIGARNLQADGMPAKNTFANRFSNFWYRVETLIRLRDTQSGYRIYPLASVGGMRFFTPRYEFEVEAAVRLAWRGVRVVNVPIRVLYPEDRVSHFRPGPDFLRISVLNTVLVAIALLWYYPVALFRWLRGGGLRQWLDVNLLHNKESAGKLSGAVALGIGMSVLPIWGGQTAVALGVAHVLKLNKLVVGTFTNISLPPIIPIIIYVSMLLGGLVVSNPVELSMDGLTRESVQGSVLQYVIGGVMLSPLVAVAGGLLSYILIRLFSSRK